ncbi:hypothetical protein [Rhodococcus olei]
MTKLAAVAAMTIASMGVVAGTAYAEPAADSAQPVGWNVSRDGDKVLVNTTAGSLSNEDNHLVVRDAGGNLVDSVPLAIAFDGTAHPISAQIDGRTAVLTADTSPEKATPVALPLQDIDLPAAVSSVKDNLSLTASVGGFVGAASGLVGGCLLGAAAAGVVSAPAAMLFGAGPLAGCIGGALLLGSGASLAGTAIGGLGALAANAQPFMTALNAPAKK